MLGFKASIRTWLLALVLMSIVPPAIFSLIVVTDLARSREEVLTGEVIQRSNVIAVGVAQEFQRVVTILEVLSRSDRLRSGQFAAFHAEASKSLPVAPEIRSIGLIAVDGRQILNTRLPFGDPVPPSNGPDVVARTISSGRPTISEPFIGATSNEMSIAVGVPVSVNGRVAYVLKGNLRLSVLSDLIRQHKLPTDWVGALVDSNAIILARSTAVDALVGTPTTDALRRSIAAGQRGLIDSITRDGVEVRAGLSEVPGWNLFVAVGAPRALLYQPLYTWLGAMVVVGVGALVSAVVWALWLAARIAGRVGQTSLASQVLRDGRPPELVTSHIRELDDMADTLAVVSHLQAELRANEEKLRLLADSTSDMIGRLDLEGCYLYVSAAANRLYGFADHELIGRKAIDFVHPDDVLRVRETIDRVRSTHRPATVRLRRRHRNGHYVWVETAINALQAADGSIQELVIASRDITAQQQAAERLREDEGRHRAVMESAADAILLSDDEGRYVDANPVALVMTGYTIDELRQLSSTDLVAERDRHRLPEHLAATLRGERRLTDWWMRRKNGSEFLAEFSTLRLPDGRVLAVGRDVSARREAEARLQLAASVFTETNQGIVITDATANILDANPAFCEMMGYRREEVLGKNPRFLQSGYHDREFYAAIWQALASTGRWQGEMWNRSADGGVHPQQVTISAIRDRLGAVLRYLGVYADITELKQRQQKVEHLAYHDALTKLPNRLLFDDRLERALALAARNRSQVVICYLDLDGFKPVNDVYGHKSGDIVLRHVAHCLEVGVRGHDTAARLGGDEFVLVLSEVSQQSEWYPVIERVTAAIAEPCDIGDGHLVTVTASVGVAIFPNDGSEPDTLLHAADLALYQAKRTGRNRICLASDSKSEG